MIEKLLRKKIEIERGRGRIRERGREAGRWKRTERGREAGRWEKTERGREEGKKLERGRLRGTERGSGKGTGIKGGRGSGGGTRVMRGRGRGREIEIGGGEREKEGTKNEIEIGRKRMIRILATINIMMLITLAIKKGIMIKGARGQMIRSTGTE